MTDNTTRNNTADGSAGHGEDGDLNSTIRSLQAKSLLFMVLTIAIGLVSVASFFVAEEQIVVSIALVVVTIILFACRDGYRRRLKAFVADNIVRQALERVFDNMDYAPTGHVPNEYIHASKMGFGTFNTILGSDYVQGSYKGLPIEMSDIELQNVTTTTDEDGTESERVETVFRGLWLICDFGKELSADMRLWERKKPGKILGGKGIKTDNEAFNRQFYVESEVEHEAFYILTPHMMEYIMEMDKKADGETHMQFDRNGKVHIAINSNRDAFEVGMKVDAAALRGKFEQEIRYVTDIIDELRLCDTLYRR